MNRKANHLFLALLCAATLSCDISDEVSKGESTITLNQGEEGNIEIGTLNIRKSPGQSCKALTIGNGGSAKVKACRPKGQKKTWHLSFSE